MGVGVGGGVDAEDFDFGIDRGGDVVDGDYAVPIITLSVNGYSIHRHVHVGRSGADDGYGGGDGTAHVLIQFI